MSTVELICLLYGGPILLLFLFGLAFAAWDLLWEWWEDRDACRRMTEAITTEEEIEMLEEMFQR